MQRDDGGAAQGAAGVVSFRFTGQAGEYFRIWIVNISLSVLTLGIYSAWAKVRRKRYFYGNTLLDGSAFEYLGDPMAILKGRIAVVLALVLYNLPELFADSETAGLAAAAGLAKFALLLLFLGFLPYLVIKAASFNAGNSAYHNLRFRFGVGFQPSKNKPGRDMRYRQTSQFLVLPVFLVPLTLGLLYPYYAFRKRKFLLEHTAYGHTAFAFDARAGAYFLAYFKAALLFVLFLVGSVATLAIGALPLYILFASYRDVVVGRIAWRHTRLGSLRFDCHWTTWAMFKLNLGNSLAIIGTLGLMAPWAAIRAARYQLQGLSVQPGSALVAFRASASDAAPALGDEAADLLGIDFGL